MTTFYRSPWALITHDVFEVRCPYGQRFAIGELRDVQATQGSPDPFAVGATRVAGPVAAVAAASWPFLHSPAAWFAAVIMLVLPGALGGACWRWRPPEWELVGTYRGCRVQLFVTRDVRTFGQVKRGLMRALATRDTV